MNFSIAIYWKSMCRNQISPPFILWTWQAEIQFNFEQWPLHFNSVTFQNRMKPSKKENYSWTLQFLHKRIGIQRTWATALIPSILKKTRWSPIVWIWLPLLTICRTHPPFCYSNVVFKENFSLFTSNWNKAK